MAEAEVAPYWNRVVTIHQPAWAHDEPIVIGVHLEELASLLVDLNPNAVARVNHPMLQVSLLVPVDRPVDSGDPFMGQTDDEIHMMIQLLRTIPVSFTMLTIRFAKVH